MKRAQAKAFEVVGKLLEAWLVANCWMRIRCASARLGGILVSIAMFFALLALALDALAIAGR